MVTIDPARRLANSLGVDELSNSPTRIEGDWPGELHALMLDPKGTFDDLVARYADTERQAEDIRVNRIYRNLTGTLSGTQEYMAMEKLYELVEEGGFDVIVVDTPPSRNALDFLDAPRRLTHFLENRVFQALMAPTRVGLRFMGVAAQALLRTIAKVAGADIVHDAVAFFQAFEGMEEGFRLRAARVRELLVQPSTAFVLVASPRPDSVDEAVHFSGKLAESGMSATALIVNRVQPRFASDEQLAVLAPFAGRSEAGDGPDGGPGRPGGEPGRLHPGIGPRGGGLRLVGGRGVPRPRLPGPAVDHRRPRPRRPGRRGRPAVPDRSGLTSLQGVPTVGRHVGPGSPVALTSGCADHPRGE